MTRKLTVLDRFEHGTLVEITPSPHYADEGTAHVYYVSEKARLDAGMEIVDEEETFGEFADDQTGADWDAIRDQAPATDLVERAEKRILNRTEGDIADGQLFGGGSYSLRRSVGNRQDSIPVGVVKFGDADADHEDTPSRSATLRGYCWAAVQEHVLSEGNVKTLQYQNDADHPNTFGVRVPMCVVMAGDEMLAAYLTAHDHHDALIAHALGREEEEVREMITAVTTI